MLGRRKVYLHGLLYTSLITILYYWIKISNAPLAKTLQTGKRDRMTLNMTLHHMLTYANGLSSTRRSTNRDVRNVDNEMIIEDGLYWSQDLERILPKGISQEETENFYKDILRTKVVEVHSAEKSKCASRESRRNKFVILANNQTMCVRNQQQTWTAVNGEILSYHLSKLLGMDNVPPIKYTEYNTTWKLWSKVPVVSRWKSDQRLTMSLFVNGLSSGIPIPNVLLLKLNTSTTLTYKDHVLQNLSKLQLMDLMQMSDLILFDFLIRNGDRILRNKFQSERPARWFKKTFESKHQHLYMTSPIKNLCIQPKTHKFWLLDNDVTFNAANKNVQKRLIFNESMLKTICVFRRSTIENIKRIGNSDNMFELLYKRVKKLDYLFWKTEQHLLSHSKRGMLMKKSMKKKVGLNLKKLLRWIEYCESI